MKLIYRPFVLHFAGCCMTTVFVRVASTALLSISSFASAQTAWPEFMPTLKGGWSNSSVAAQLPPEVLQSPPDNPASAGKAQWAGQWQGWAGRDRSIDLKLVVSNVTDSTAIIDYAAASSTLAPFYQRVNGRFVGNELQAFVAESASIAFRMRASGELEYFWSRGTSWRSGVLTKTP